MHCIRSSHHFYTSKRPSITADNRNDYAVMYAEAVHQLRHTLVSSLYRSYQLMSHETVHEHAHTRAHICINTSADKP